DPGVRHSSYATVGKIATYNPLGDVKVANWIKFRGGYQYANRAPNVNELFTPRGGSTLVFGIVDSCANFAGATPTWGNVPSNPNRLNVQALCQQLMVRDGAPPTLYVPGTDSANNYDYNVFGGRGTNFPISIGVTEGNPGLGTEAADTYTAGFVFDIPTKQRLRLSVDWFRIELTNAIGIPGHDVIYQQCLDAKYNPLVGSAPGSHSGAGLLAYGVRSARSRPVRRVRQLAVRGEVGAEGWHRQFVERGSRVGRVDHDQQRNRVDQLQLR